jgi:hypothetical protein
MLLRALPLRAGLAVSLEMYEPDGARSVRASIRVVGVERVVTADDGSCAAWRVEVEGPDSYNGIFWIGETSRAMVRWQADANVMFLRMRGCPGDGR